MNQVPPDQVPRDYIEWLQRMQAMEASQRDDGESSQVESLRPNAPKQRPAL